MQEKKENVGDVEKLWMILLYDASFNRGTKTFGRRRMLRAKAMDAVAPEQHVLAREKFGSRKDVNMSHGASKTTIID
jgi:hypothetical protein